MRVKFPHWRNFCKITIFQLTTLVYNGLTKLTTLVYNGLVIACPDLLSPGNVPESWRAA